MARKMTTLTFASAGAARLAERLANEALVDEVELERLRAAAAAGEERRRAAMSDPAEDPVYQRLFPAAERGL